MIATRCSSKSRLRPRYPIFLNKANKDRAAVGSDEAADVKKRSCWLGCSADTGGSMPMLRAKKTGRRFHHLGQPAGTDFRVCQFVSEPALSNQRPATVTSAPSAAVSVTATTYF